MNSFKTKVTFVVHKANSSSSINSEFPDGTMVKNPAADAGDIRDVSSIPGLGRSPGVENGNPFQYSCLENSTDKRSLEGRRDGQATVHGAAKSRTRQSD